jgi:hypothetical protein
MEAMLGISLYSYLYLKLAKMLFFLLSLMFCIQQNWRTRGRNRFCLEARRGRTGGRGRRRWRERTREWGGGAGVGSKRKRWPKQCIHI